MARVRRRRRTVAGRLEGRYDPRKGAQGYAPIVASFGALAVTAIVVVFNIPADKISDENLTLATGLLVIGVFAGFLGSFGLAAVAAEDDPTANLAATVMFMAVPVAFAFTAILGAFEVLAATFVPKSTTLFAIITAAGGATAVVFSGFVVGDSWALHPTTMGRQAVAEWRSRQWIQGQEQANAQTTVIVVAGLVPMVIAVVLRIAAAHIDIGIVGISALIYGGVIIAMAAYGTSPGRVKFKPAPWRRRSRRIFAGCSGPGRTSGWSWDQRGPCCPARHAARCRCPEQWSRRRAAGCAG